MLQREWFLELLPDCTMWHAGVGADIDMAKDCYKQAAHAGLIRPQVNLGYVALKAQQYNKAAKHFRVSFSTH